MIITREKINAIKEIPVCYGDDEIRMKNRTITLNKYTLSGLYFIKISDSLVLFLGENGKEILRTKKNDILSIKIDEEYGVYQINKK